MKHLSFMKKRGVSSGSKKLLLSVAILSFILSACTTSPTNHAWVTMRQINLSGFAIESHARIDIQAFNQNTKKWNTVTTVYASSNPSYHFGGQTLYQWNLNNFDFTKVPSYECYWGYDGWCSIPAGSADAKFRFKHNGNSMFTFDEGGINCVINNVATGGTLVNATLACASKDSPVLTLHQIT